jgi:hypothetical protein
MPIESRVMNLQPMPRFSEAAADKFVPFRRAAKLVLPSRMDTHSWPYHGGALRTTSARTRVVKQNPAHASHQLPSLSKQIASTVSRLDLVLDRIRQRHFDHLAREVRALGRPIWEGRPKAVRGQVISCNALEERHIVFRKAPAGSLARVWAFGLSATT